MRKEDKYTVIEEIGKALQEYSCLYLTETTGLNAEKTSALRRACFNSGIKLFVVKNTLLKKAMEQSGVDYSGLFPVLKGSTSLMLSNTGNAPAKLLKDFVKKDDKLPTLKAAYVEGCVYGADQLELLASLKSKNELICCNRLPRTLSRLCNLQGQSFMEYLKLYLKKNNKLKNKQTKSYNNGRFESFCRTIGKSHRY